MTIYRKSLLKSSNISLPQLHSRIDRNMTEYLNSPIRVVDLLNSSSSSSSSSSSTVSNLNFAVTFQQGEVRTDISLSIIGNQQSPMPILLFLIENNKLDYLKGKTVEQLLTSDIEFERMMGQILSNVKD